MAYNEEISKNDTVNEVWNRYQYMRTNGHDDYIKKANKCEKYFEGEQWDATDLSVLKSQRRPALTINKIISTISNVMGEQIFNRTEISFKPRNGDANEEIAQALTKVFMYISDNNHLPWVRSDIFTDGIITGRGFYDVRMDFYDNLRGEVRVKRLNPKNVLLDPDAEDYNPDEWSDVIVTKWLSLQQIELIYGKAVAEQIQNSSGTVTYPYGYDILDNERDRFGTPRSIYTDAHTPNFLWNTRWIRVLERQYKVLDRIEHFVDIDTGELSPVPGDWDRDKIKQYLDNNQRSVVIKKLAYKYKWCVIAGTVLVHEADSPYNHLTVVPFFPYLRNGRTIGLVENLLGPQELLNKVSSQELHVVNTSANSGWKVKSGALRNMSISELEQRGAQTGLVLELEDVDAADKILPNTVPTGLDRISFKAEEHIKSISGVTDYMTGQAREDVAAKAVKLNQQVGRTGQVPVMDSLVRSDTILARNVLDLVQGFMTAPQILRVTTDRITGETSPLELNQPLPDGRILNDLTIGDYDVVVSTQPERDTFEDSQFEQAVRLKLEAGVAIPDDVIVAASRLKDKSEIVRRMRASMDSPEAQEQAQLEMAAKRAEVAKLGMEVQAQAAKAELDKAKAAEANGNDLEGIAEYEKMQQEMQMKREQMEMEHQLEIEKLNHEMMLKEKELVMTMRIKEEEAKGKVLVQRAQAAMALKQAGQQAPAKPKSKGTK